MARPEKPIDPTAPYATFAQQLRKLRRAAGSPTYATLAWRTRYSVPALSQAATGGKLPSLDLTLAYAMACGGDREHWTEQWLIAQYEAGPASLDGPAATEVRPWSTRPPSPASADSPQEFIACLRQLKLWAGNPSLSRLEDIARNETPGAARLPRSTIGDALSPKRTSLPNSFVVRPIVLACLTFAQRQSRIRPEETGPVVEEWQERWVCLYRSGQRQRSLRPTPKAATDPLSVFAEKTVEVTDLPLPRTRMLRAPLNHVPRAQRVLAEELRTLFNDLDMSLREFAMRHHMDASTVSRYLSGSRIPPQHFLRRLLGEALMRPGHQVPPDTLHRLLDVHQAALRTHTAPHLQSAAEAEDPPPLVLRQALDDARSRLRRSIEMEVALRAELHSRQKAIAELEARLREIQGSRSPQSA
ncbi:helix-turn-helix domain-containing protein [Streptomyces netropsis]|uniref:helix-turn-helix domain-containing protein n=1 Tax=Streptomyces netropsis TaxID=55404 RepID=UPI0037B4D195